MSRATHGVLQKDDNGYPVMGGVSSADATLVLNSEIDPITGRLLVDLIGGGGGTAVYNEVVAGNTTTFTLAHTPTAGTVRVYGLGQRLVPTTDWTISGAIITTVSTWSTGQIVADYNY